MSKRIRCLTLAGLSAWVSLAAAVGKTPPASWHGIMRDEAGRPLASAVVELQAASREGPIESAGHPALTTFKTISDEKGNFEFGQLPAGRYSVVARWRGRTAGPAALELGEGERMSAALEASFDRGQLVLRAAAGAPESRSSGGERLSSSEVSSLPLNKRDFSQLLLLAAGTMTDTNGAANFTQQFAVNGQRGTTAVFAIDGIYASDAELGGATFANFNVDAIQEVQSSSGTMPASIGQGAAGFTNVATKSGTEKVHGAVFEFLRNAGLDARNFFDRRTAASPGRLPPFTRNEFGFTNGGPVVLPGIYNGRERTFYFGQYQGFRQVLGTTQVFPVPTAAERQGMDTTAFPGDTLFVPVSPAIAPVLARYPLPNDPQGAYGARTFATSSKVATVSNQFSVRIDHRISEKGQLFARFNFNNVTGPTTNPSQTAIDPGFGIRFLDRQRNFGLIYTRAPSPRFTSETSFGFLRTTPRFTSTDRTQPGLTFGDGLYEPFNSAAGTVIASFGEIFQVRQNLAIERGTHSFKLGIEARINHDTAIFGFAPNGSYTFGSGTAYSSVAIPSATGQHDVSAGDPLPDTLSGFLTATPFAFTAQVAPPEFAQGDHIGESAIRRAAYDFYIQDNWKISPRLVASYGLRYELDTQIAEAKRRSSNMYFVDAAGRPARSWDPGAREKFLLNPQPPYELDWNGWGPRLAVEWRATSHTTLHAGGSIATLLPNLFQENLLTGGLPFVVTPYFAASPGSPVPFTNSLLTFTLPPMLTPAGQPVFVTGRTTDVPANTEMDIERFERDLAALTPGGPFQALSVFGMARDLRNGYIESYTAGLDQEFRDVNFSLAYVATVGVKLASIFFPNNYGGADPAFAPFSRFDTAGNIMGGFGPEYLMTDRSHSTYHSLQATAEKTSARAGLGFLASYTFSKSLDDTSNIFGGFTTPSGAVLQTFPADPRNPGAEKGPSTYDLAHTFVLSLIQALPFDRIVPSRPAARHLAAGWKLLNITTLTSGPPFSVFSGIQQTGVGSYNADRPDQVGRPVFSTARTVREDYFGQGAGNTAFFYLPVGVPGGTGPNQGRLGTLGRNTFRGPAFHNLDVALIKDSAFGRRRAGEVLTLQFRAEFFNVLSLVNFSLPANIVRGTGFGLISRTAGPSRQLQFSLKLIY